MTEGRISRLLAAAMGVMVQLIACLAAQPPPQPPGDRQFRAFWVNTFAAGLKSPAEILQTFADLQAANANALLAQVGRRGDAYYNQSLQPRTDDRDLAPGFDALQHLIDLGRRSPNPIEIHAWLSTLALWNRDFGIPTDPRHAYNAHGPGRPDSEIWMTRRSDGTWLAGNDYCADPGHPDALDYVVRMYLYAIGHYDIDGIHLDRVRFPEVNNSSISAPAQWGYNPTSLARFRRLTGSAVVPPPDDGAWVEWRRRQLRQLVRKIYLSAVALNPGIKVTAATVAFGAGPLSMADYLISDTYRRTLQDPIGYMQEGILDICIPMNYDRDHDASQYKWFRDWIEFEKNHTFNRHLAIGTGLYLNTIANSIVQLRAALSPSSLGNKAQGVAGYSLQATNSENLSSSEFAHALSRPSRHDSTPAPLFPNWVPAPEMSWKTQPQTGHLVGTITADASGPADELAITLRGPANRQVTSDGRGWFGFADVPPGTYEVRIDGAPAGEPIQVEAGMISAVTLERGRRTQALIFPDIAESATGYTGLAFTNLGSSTARLDGTLYGDSGQPLGQSTLTLVSGSQSARLVREMFPSLASGAIRGWLSIQGDQPQVAGFFQQGDFDGDRLDGALSGLRTAQHLVFTRIAHGKGFYSGEAQTELLIVNPASLATTVALQLLESSGKVLHRRVEEIPARGRLRGTVAELFPAAVLPLRSGYVVARGATEIAGFSWLRYPESVIGLGAETPGMGKDLFAAHFSSGTLSGVPYFSNLSLVNTGGQEVELVITAVGDDGRALAMTGGSNPARLRLAARAQWIGDMPALFGIPGEATPAAYLQGALVIQSSSGGVVGSLAFGQGVDARFAAALPLQRELSREILFGHVASGSSGPGGPRYFTGLGLFNPGPQHAQVILEVFQASGGLRGRAQRTLAPGQRLSQLVDQFVPEASGLLGGFVRIRSEEGLAAYELFGDSEFHFLSAVPPQRVSR